MPRGFKRDEPATRAAYADGRLIDQQKRSFISQPKAIPGECEDPLPHLLLFGADKTKARMELFRRERSRCQGCGLVLVWGGEDSDDGMVGEWKHIRDKGWNKCDCPANAELSCHNCHQGPGAVHYQRRPQFGKREEVKV